MSKMKLEVVKRRIESFEKRFGKVHLYLAYHAAFPLSLTPDLLYRLWANFQKDIHSEVLGIPWIAVADLLLSSLFNEVGHELYEMDLAVRNELLSRLKEDEKFAQQRINELSDFLLEYVQQQLLSDDPDIQDFAQAQRWVALAYTRPNEAARELALAFSKLDHKDKTELVRMASLAETFAEPLTEFQPLLIYARGMEKFARGNLKDAIDRLREVPKKGNVLQVAGIDLSIPEQLQIPKTKRRSHLNIPWFSLLKFLGTSVGVTTLVVFMRFCGIFQASELWFFDQMMQFQPTESQDDRLLVIEVTKEDIDKQEGIKRGSLTDKTLLTLLKTLLKYPQNQPKTIGLDIYRDFATETKEFSQPENKKLSNLLKTESRIIAVCNIGDLSQNNKGTAPPPEIPTKRLGFSDFLSDSEGIVRRQILSIETPKSSPCWSSKEPVSNAFSLELAQHYLGKQYEEIKDRSIRLRLGDTTFDLLDGRHRGGYSFWTDLEGYQVLLNYRVSCSEKKKNDCSPQYVAERVTLDDVNKSDFLTKYSLKDKIVLIGVSDYSYEAPWFTPFSSKGHAPIPGVIIQAQMVSQIVSAVLDKRPLLRVLPIWYEILWILFWSLLGGAIAQLRFSSIPQLSLSTEGLIISGGFVFIGLYCSCVIYFITPNKYWMPFVPSALTFLGTGGVVIYVRSLSSGRVLEQ
ncbi:CHASE2 domain-containing protein [Mastigocladopsis repens]|uniref:CHASE2 domain-containing protein n=1 Tax=Mastigocladopsis repens TaxID=221287 RepID=UPI000319D35C|nr:CHASE2 domain-containing protein [Mastigocladopsis repens]